MAGAKQVIGVPLGDAAPQVFIPFLVDLLAQGRLPVDKLSKVFDAKDINKALEAMKVCSCALIGSG